MKATAATRAMLERVRMRLVVTVVVLKELLSLVALVVCVQIRGHSS